jgi:hypothetical protein
MFWYFEIFMFYVGLLFIYVRNLQHFIGMMDVVGVSYGINFERRSLL